MIQIEHLTRHYGELTAVDDVTFQIRNGEVVGLLGHNGAGKTTIMKMVTGFLEPTSGTIRVEDLEVGRDKSEPFPDLVDSMPVESSDESNDGSANEEALHDGVCKQFGFLMKILPTEGVKT